MKNIQSIIIRISIAIMLLFSFNSLYAQQDPMYSQYMFNMLSLNPAYAGSRDVLSMTALARKQWVGIAGAPTTFTFSADAPIAKERIGLGVNIVNDKIGIVQNLMANICYSYRIRFENRGTLSLGLQAGINQYNADYGSVNASGANNTLPDPAFSSSVNQIFPNFGFGVYYATDKFYIGASAPKLLKNSLGGTYDPSLDFSSFRNRQNRHYFITAGYVFTLSETIKLKPSLMFKAVGGAPMQLDFNANVWFHDRFSIGASYRTGDAITAMIEVQANQQFRVGYAYDYTTSKLATYNSGSHEIMLRYEFGFEKGKILSPRYF